MKKIIFLAALAAATASSYAQNRIEIGSAGQAIEILRGNDLMKVYGYQLEGTSAIVELSEATYENIVANSPKLEEVRLSEAEYGANLKRAVGLFVGEVDKIVGVTQPELKEQLLSVVEKREGYANDYTILFWNALGRPFIGRSILDVLRQNFSDADYTMLSEALSARATEAVSAYEYLSKAFQRDNPLVYGVDYYLGYIEMVYEYFEIR